MTWIEWVSAGTVTAIAGIIAWKRAGADIVRIWAHHDAATAARAEPEEHVGATEQTAGELLDIHYDHIFRPARPEPWSLDKPAPPPWNELPADPNDPTPLGRDAPAFERLETFTQAFGEDLIAIIREQDPAKAQALLDARYGGVS